MFDFEKALRGDSGGIPIHEAASFYNSVRQIPAPTADGQVKTAGWEDPPDTEGLLEGSFSVPKEHAVALMGDIASALLRIMNATLIYGNSVRGPNSAEVRNVIRHRSYCYQDALEYLVGRMTALAGPPHIAEPDIPPASVDPIEIAKRIIRAEQELVELWRGMVGVAGDNAMRSRAESYMASAQERVDELWRAIPAEAMQPPEPAVMEAPPPEDPTAAAEAAEAAPAPEAAPAEAPSEDMETTSSVKTAELSDAGYGLAGAGLGGASMFALPVGLSAPVGGGIGSYYGAKRGRKVGKAGEGAQRGGLGTVAGAVPGGLVGGGLGGALGAGLGYGVGALSGGAIDPRAAALVGGLSGAGLGGAGGSIAGGLTGYNMAMSGLKPDDQVKSAAARMADWVKMAKDETDLELKEKGRQRGVSSIAAEHEREKSRRGERAGKALGVLGGAAAGGVAGRKLIGGPAGTIAGAGLGALAGRSLGGELGTEADIARAVQPTAIQKAASRMVNWVKTAQDVPGGGGEPEAAMSSPTDAPELMPQNYLQAEQIGQQLQNRNEADFYKQKATAAEQQVMQAQQGAQATQMQLEQLQMDAAAAGQKIEQALGQATQATDKALEQTEIAANLRMGMQQQRAQMMEIASQDPNQMAADALGLTTAPPPPVEGPPPGAGPPPANPADQQKEVEEAGRAQDEATLQGMQAQQATGTPPPGGPPPGGPPSPPPGGAPPPGTKMGSAGLGAGIGAGIGAAYEGAKARHASTAGTAGLQQQIQQLKQTQDGSFRQAARLAGAQKQIIDRNLAASHPGKTMALGAAKGAVKGALMGGSTGGSIGRLFQ